MCACTYVHTDNKPENIFCLVHSVKKDGAGNVMARYN